LELIGSSPYRVLLSHSGRLEFTTQPEAKFFFRCRGR
jgi:hypothetical protein